MRTRGGRLAGTLGFSHITKKVSNSIDAVRNTYYFTKETFEKHKTVFTIGTSVASVATAWTGYTLRHYHESRIDRRLESIEKAITDNTQLERSELRSLVESGNSRTVAWFATAATTFILGYGFGWQGGRWYAARKFRADQVKLLGQLKPSGWQLLGKVKSKALQLQALRRRLATSRSPSMPAVSCSQNGASAPAMEGGLSARGN